jgi:hypothetical protein
MSLLKIAKNVDQLFIVKINTELCISLEVRCPTSWATNKCTSVIMSLKIPKRKQLITQWAKNSPNRVPLFWLYLWAIGFRKIFRSKWISDSRANHSFVNNIFFCLLTFALVQSVLAISWMQNLHLWAISFFFEGLPTTLLSVFQFCAQEEEKIWKSASFNLTF